MVVHAKVLDSSEQLLAITHPTRLRVLDALRTPDSAAGVARTLGEPRQRINHHVKELEKAGLVVPAGERRNGNFVEQLFESVAGTFVVSPRLAWGDDGGERARAMADQLSLQHLVELGERLHHDAAALLDRAAFDAEEIPSAAVEATVHFADPGARAAFLQEYLDLTAGLIERHATATGPGFTVGLFVHPATEEGAMTEFRTSFEVRVDPSEAWSALEDLQAERATDAGDARQWWLPGFESTGTELSVEHGRELTVRKDHWPCAETIISITFEHVESGAQITIVQSGFDEAFVAGSGEGFWIVCEHLAADLRLFFETGVIGGRHGRPWAPIGCSVRPTPLGLEVTEVWAETWAARAGLQRGDVLLILAGAPLTAVRDFVTLQRVVSPGEELGAVWVRGRDRIEASLSV